MADPGSLSEYTTVISGAISPPPLFINKPSPILSSAPTLLLSPIVRRDSITGIVFF